MLKKEEWNEQIEKYSKELSEFAQKDRSKSLIFLSMREEKDRAVNVLQGRIDDISTLLIAAIDSICKEMGEEGDSLRRTFVKALLKDIKEN